MKQRKYQQPPPQPAPPDRIKEELLRRVSAAMDVRRESKDAVVRYEELLKVETALRQLLLWTRDGVVPGQ